MTFQSRIAKRKGVYYIALLESEVIEHSKGVLGLQDCETGYIFCEIWISFGILGYTQNLWGICVFLSFGPDAGLRRKYFWSPRTLPSMNTDWTDLLPSNLDKAEKKIAMFPPYRPGETFFLLTRAREKSTIPFFPFTLKFLFYFLRYSH